jgi:hypothetical protein
MNPKWVLWIAGVSAVLYIGVAFWVINNPNFDIPPLSGSALALVVLAGFVQITAKWFFGLLFRESVRKAGGEIRAWSAFKAALVGAGVARMIPAGGAITPVAMSWTVREEADGSAGAGIRTVLLNYSGLLIMTGVGLLFARPEESAQIASISLFVLAPFVLVAGLAFMFGSGKLGTLVRFLPRFAREKLEQTTIDHLPGWESQIYIWTRLVLEAGALWIVLFAFGIEVNAFQAMAAFGVSQLAGGLPGTPGGMGVVEGTLTFVLVVAYGFPVSAIIAPVLVFRVVSFWLPAVLGFLAGGSTFLRSEAAKKAEAAG